MWHGRQTRIGRGRVTVQEHVVHVEAIIELEDDRVQSLVHRLAADQNAMCETRNAWKPVVVLMIRNVVRLSRTHVAFCSVLEDSNVVDGDSNVHKVIRHSELQCSEPVSLGNVESIHEEVARRRLSGHFMDVLRAILVLSDEVPVEGVEEHGALSDLLPESLRARYAEYAPRLIGRHNVRH